MKEYSTTPKIEKKVPLPKGGQKRSGKYLSLFLAMKCGDSFVIPDRQRNGLAASVSHFRRRHPEGKKYRFTIRRISETECRIWRIE
jgi:hypothetical protein